MHMKAAYYPKPGQGILTELPDPVCGPDEVIIRVMSAAYCKGAELEHDSPEGTGPGRYPVVPGHEFAGIVHQVGAAVTGWAVGDRVTADNTQYCMTCEACHEGRFNNCQHMGSLGHNINGGFAQYVRVKAEKLYRLPDDMSFDTAAITEMVACCIFALDQAELQPGDSVAVIGLGAAAAILAQLLRCSVARDTVVIGSTPGKLALMREFGLKAVLMDRKDYSIHRNAALALHPEGYDVVIDTTAHMPLATDCFSLLRRGGKLCEFGVPKGGSVHWPRELLLSGEYSYRPVGNQTHCFSRALQCLESGIVDGAKTVTATLPLDDYFKGLDLLRHDSSQLKVVVHPWPEAPELGGTNA